MGINPILGHEIKVSKSEQLAQEVQAWLDAGNQITDCEPTFVIKKLPFNNAEFSPNSSPVRVRQPSIQTHLRIQEQSEFLKKYRELFSSWQALSVAAGVSRRQLQRTCLGETSFARKEVWQKIKIEAVKLMEMGK